MSPQFVLSDSCSHSLSLSLPLFIDLFIPNSSSLIPMSEIFLYLLQLVPQNPAL